jgi:hypothetical protein
MSSFPSVNLSLSNVLTATSADTIAPFSASNLYSIVNTSYLPSQDQPLSLGFFRNLNLVVVLFNPVVNFDASTLSSGIDSAINIWENTGSLTAFPATAYGTTKPILRKPGDYYHVEFNRTNLNYFNVSNLPFTWFNVGGVYNGFTLFVVAQYTGAGYYERFMDFADSAGNNNIWFGRLNTGNAIGAEILNGTTVVTSFNNLPGPFIENGGYHIFSMHVTNTSTGGICSLYCDNTKVSSKTFSIPLANRTSSFNYIGRSHFYNDAYLNANMRQFLIYNYALTDRERLIAYNSLKLKWGMT